VLAAAEKARRLSDRLSDRDRALLEASLAFRRGTADEAERLFRTLLGRYPDDVQAWFELGEVLFHSNPFRGRSGVEAREPFQRVLHFDSDDGAPMIHLIRLEAADGNLAAVDSLVDRFIAIAGAGERALEVRAVQAFAHDDAAAEERVLEELATAPDVTLQTAAWSVTIFGGDLAEAERVIRLMTAPDRSPEVRANGNLWLAYVYLAGGRVSAARQEFERARSVSPTAVWVYYEMVAASLSFFPSDDAEVERLAALAGSLPAEPTGAPVEPRLLQGVEAHVRRFVEGIAAARLGRTPGVRAAASELSRLGGITEAPSLGDDLARTVSGYAALRAGSPAEALAQLEGMEMTGGYFLSFFSSFHSHAFARWVRASALEQAGRGEDADRWYATLVWTTPTEIVYRAPAELARGRIAEAAGRPADAAAHYERFAELWRDADAELQPEVEEARRAAARLRAQ
jgi:tetratricopeptide (TPR) repeat protein